MNAEEQVRRYNAAIALWQRREREALATPPSRERGGKLRSARARIRWLTGRRERIAKAEVEASLDYWGTPSIDNHA